MPWDIISSYLMLIISLGKKEEMAYSYFITDKNRDKMKPPI